MTWVVVPAAGRGRRFAASNDNALPKQYINVAGEPLIGHTLRALLSHPRIMGAMVVIAADDAHWPGWTCVNDKPVMRCIGADERAGSVLAGLMALPATVRDDDFVLVHDAARPNVSHVDLERLLDLGSRDPVGAILGAPVRDTLKRAGDDGGIDGTEPRERLWRAFTPQMFRRKQLMRALAAAAEAGVAVTDEAMAMERQGLRPLLVEGNEDNFKITTPADLARLEYILSRATSAENVR